MALNICTYKRVDYIERNIAQLRSSGFFDKTNSEYYDRLEIFIVDNASEIDAAVFERDEHIHLYHNPNTGGAGGFQRGIEEIRRNDAGLTHVIFMDDDVRFETESFYILYDFLRDVDDEYADRPVAGRMFDIDNPDIHHYY